MTHINATNTKRQNSLLPLIVAPVYVATAFSPIIQEIGIVSPLVFLVIAFFVLVLEQKALQRYTRAAE